MNSRFLRLGVCISAIALVFKVVVSPVQADLPSCSADINIDGAVNLADYSILASQFFDQGSNLQADINNDFVVNLLDYSVLAGQFLDQCSLIPDPSPAPSPSPSPAVSPTPTASPTPIPTPSPTPQSGIIEGIWISQAELGTRPTSGTAWTNLVDDSKQSTTNPDFSDQDSKVDVYTLAKALVYAKTPNATCDVLNCAVEVRDSIKKLMDTHPVTWNASEGRWEADSWDWLGVIRGLGSYAAAADAISLSTYDPVVDAEFRAWLPKARNAWVEDGRGSVVTAQEMRPNNFGAHAAASRIAVDIYLNDTADLQRAVTVFKGQLGDRNSYKEYTGSNNCSANSCQGFDYGELWYQCDEANPVPLNAKNCTKNGHLMDGALPDDQRRCGSGFEWPPCVTEYSWEGLQGLVAAAELLHRQGYDSYQWSDQALLRAFEYLDNTTFSSGNNFPAAGDDEWLVFIIDKRYGTTYKNTWSISPGVSPGKMYGYTDWILQ